MPGQTLAAAFADLDTVLAELRGAADPPLSVDYDPARVLVPGVWVLVDQLSRDRLAGTYTARLRLHLLAADTEHMAARAQLAELHDVVAPVVDSYGGAVEPTRPVVVVMPSAARLPALAVVVDIETE